MSVLLQLKAILKRWRSILSLGPVSNGEKCSQMNILRRHSRHSSLYWHAVWSPLKLQFVLSPLTISEATCSVKELNKINLTFQGNNKAVLLPTTQDPRLVKAAKIHGIAVTDKHNTKSKRLKPRWARYPLRCTAANHANYFLCKLPRCSLFEIYRETLRFCWKSRKKTSWPQAHGSFEREGNVTCHVRHVITPDRPRDTNS